MKKQKTKTQYDKPDLTKMSPLEAKRERQVAFFRYLLDSKTATELIEEMQ